jgi:Na+/H+ antiporter NhaA
VPAAPYAVAVRLSSPPKGDRAGQSRPRRPGSDHHLGRELRAYLTAETGSAGLLLATVVLALAWANSPLGDAYASLWSTDVTISAGDAVLSMDLRHWVNDGLMFLFFLVIGIEVRRELSTGELAGRQTVTVPVLAGLGGIVVPAAIYFVVGGGDDAPAAWGIVIATDTAFLLGALGLVGATQSTPLRVFLLTLTIVDDVVAVTVIAVFYSQAVDMLALGLAAVCVLAVVALGRRRVWRAGPYAFAAVGLWLAMIESGVHPAIGGMAMGLAISAYPPDREAVQRVAALVTAFSQSPVASLARSAQRGVIQAVSPGERIQTALHPWVSYGVVPLFALANGGVDLHGDVLTAAVSSPLTWAVVVGLVIGKPLGITIVTLAAVRLGVGRLPRGVTRAHVLGGGALSGIGFTVSLLIVELGIDSPQLREEAKVGVLFAAVAALLAGWLVFRAAGPPRLPDVLDPPVDPARDHIRGPVDAPLTLLEFADFECPFCGHATGVIDDLRRRFGDELRYVFRHLPLTDVHTRAGLAAEAAEAAAAQGRFWDYHDLLYRHQDELEFEDLLGYAGALDLDVERFARELELGIHADRVLEDVVSAEASGARGTPTFFVCGRRHVGPHDAATLAAALEACRPIAHP